MTVNPNANLCLDDLCLIDTHTHFDWEMFDHDRIAQAQYAHQAGIKSMVLIGVTAARFGRLLACQQALDRTDTPKALLAPGLHPLYMSEHTPSCLQSLEAFLGRHACVAVGEIGLDGYDDATKATLAAQKPLFANQLAIAKQHKLPVLLHIRKSHGEALAVLKSERFLEGGIAHSFSGGIQEAKAFVNLGFKIGITGQITNPNAKKLRNTVLGLTQALGAKHLVIETDCPDFTPLPCQEVHGRRNVPANLVYVLETLADLLGTPKHELAHTLWSNSKEALRCQPDAF